MAPKRLPHDCDLSYIPNCRVSSNFCLSSHMLNSTHAASCCLSSLCSNPVKPRSCKHKPSAKSKVTRKLRKPRRNVLKDSQGWKSKVGCGRLHYNARSHKVQKSVLKKKKPASKKRRCSRSKQTAKTGSAVKVTNSMALMPPPPLPEKSEKTTAERTLSSSHSQSLSKRSKNKSKTENSMESSNSIKSSKNKTASNRRTEETTFQQSNNGLHLCENCTANINSAVADIRSFNTRNSSNLFKVGKVPNQPSSNRPMQRICALNRNYEERMEAETAETDRDVSDCEFHSFTLNGTKRPPTQPAQRPVTRGYYETLKLSEASQCSPATIKAAQNPQHNIITSKQHCKVTRPAAGALTQTPTYFTALQEEINPISNRVNTSCCSDIYVIALPSSHLWSSSQPGSCGQIQKVVSQKMNEYNPNRTKHQGGGKSNSSSSSSSRPSRQSAIIARAKISKIYEPRRWRNKTKH